MRRVPGKKQTLCIKLEKAPIEMVQPKFFAARQDWKLRFHDDVTPTLRTANIKAMGVPSPIFPIMPAGGSGRLQC